MIPWWRLKLQTAALEAGEIFRKAISTVDKKAEYSGKVVRARDESDPKITRKQKPAPQTGETA